MLWKHPTNIPRPHQQPKKRRHYYECDCGSKWSMVFETGDGKPRTRKDAGGAVVVRVDVGDDQPPEPLCPHLHHCSVNRGHRFLGVHTAIHQVRDVAVRKQEDVDQAVLEWDRQAQLEDVSCHLG